MFNRSRICKTREKALTDIVGAVILIGIFTAVAGIVVVHLLSTPLPEKIPKTDFNLTNNSPFIIFENRGGDSLDKNNILIRAIESDHTAKNFVQSDINFSGNSSLNFFPWPNGSRWSYGTFTRIYAPGAEAFQIIYLGSKGEYLLKQFNKGYFEGGESVGVTSNCSLDSGFTSKDTLNNQEFDHYITLPENTYSATIQFNATNQSYTKDAGFQWGWIFSNGGETTDLNTAHTFTIPNNKNASYNYQITHWIANNQHYNCTSITTKTLTIFPYISPSNPCSFSDFTASTTCPGRQVSFTGTSSYSSPVSSWNYTYSDGTEITNKQSDTVPFSADGTYEIIAHVVYEDGNYCSIAHTLDVNCCNISAAFSASESSSSAGDFKFIDESTPVSGITNWYWDFGDNTNSTLQNPSHSYTSCGEKTVFLTVKSSDTACKSDTASKKIKIATIPVTADFTFSLNSTYDYYYTFTNTSVSNADITSRIWTFSDDGSTETGDVVYHQFTGEGDYEVTLTATNNCGASDTITKTVRVTRYCPNITAGFSFVTDTTVYNAIFTDTSFNSDNITSWRWDFGDGEFTTWNKAQWTAAGKTTTHHYPEVAPYTATLTIGNDCGKTDSIHKLIFNGSCKSVFADFTPLTSYITSGHSVTFNITNPANATYWNWTFGDGEYTDTTSSNNITHRYTKAGTYTVSLHTGNECGSTDTKVGTVIVTCTDIAADFIYQQFIDKQANNLTIDFTDTSYNTSIISLWRWDFGDGTDATWNWTLWNEAGHKISHRYPELAPYTAKLTVDSDCGATNYTHKLIYNGTPCSEVLANFSPLYVEDKAPKEVTFTDLTNNATSWNWNFGDGYTSEVQNPTHLFNESGRYTVSLTAANDCGLSGIKTGTVNISCPNVTASFGYDYLALDSATQNLTVIFNDTSNDYGKSNITSWTWTFGDGTKTTWDKTAWQAAAGRIVHKYPDVASYTAMLEIANECGSTDWTSRLIYNGSCSSNFSVNFSPLESNGTPPLPVQFIEKTINVTSWFWNFGDGFSSEEQNPIHTYNQSGLYAVTLTGYNSCGLSKQQTGYVNVTCPGVTADYGYQYLAANTTTNNLTVSFTDLSQGHGNNITQWTWDFGDGTTTTWDKAAWQTAAGQLTHKFPSLTTYLVGLTVQNTCGSKDNVQKLIYNGSQCPDIIANFSPLYVNDTAPFVVNFKDLTTGSPTRWHWDFGDGSYSELVRNGTVTTGDISHTYTTVGHYLVTLIPTSDCGKSGVKSGYVDVLCSNVSIDFAYVVNNPDSEDPLDVTFTITEPSDPTELAKITEWTWLFGDGTASHEANPTHIYPTRDQYTVMLFGTNYCGNQGENLRLILLDCDNLTPWFNVTPQSGPVPLTVTFTENSTPHNKIKAWRWYFGDGGYYYTTDAQNPAPSSHTYSVAGLYNITLKVQNECTQIFTMNRTVQVKPTYVISATAGTGGTISPAGNTTVTEGDSLLYTIISNTCYGIRDVLVDNVSVGAVSTYSFTNVQANHTINASFEPTGPYTISATSYYMAPATGYTYIPTTGKISPEGTTYVTCGGSQSYTMIDAFSFDKVNYELSDVAIDGDVVGPINPYTFNNVIGNHTIVAYYAPTCFFVQGLVTNSTTGSPMSHVRLELYQNASPDIFLWYSYTNQTGYYKIPNMVYNAAQRYDVYIGNNSPTWKTMNSNLEGTTSSGVWNWRIQFNPGSKCKRFLNWTGTA